MMLGCGKDMPWIWKGRGIIHKMNTNMSHYVYVSSFKVYTYHRKVIGPGDWTAKSARLGNIHTI